MNQIHSQKTTFYGLLNKRDSNTETVIVTSYLSVHSTKTRIPLYKFTRMIGSRPVTVVADASTLQKRFPNFVPNIAEGINKLNEAAGIK